MIGALSTIGLAVSGLQIAAAASEIRDPLAEVLATEAQLARAQYEAIRRARAARAEGDVEAFVRWQERAQRAGEKRAALVQEIRAELVRRDEYDMALAEATAKLGAAAPKEI